jgi:acyl-CoA hydrolase
MIRQEYRHKLMSPEEAVSVVQSGDRVYIHSGCAEPERLVKALISRRLALKDVEIIHLLTLCRQNFLSSTKSEALWLSNQAEKRPIVGV